MNMLNHDSSIKQYFDTLEPYVQEFVMQSGVEIQSVDQLKRIAANYSAGENNSTKAKKHLTFCPRQYIILYVANI